MGRMRRLVIALASVLVAAAAAASSTASPATTATQLTTRFKAATGEKLVASKPKSYTGHYRAYDLGVQTIARKARWGTFTVYLVTGADTEAEVTDLLADSHTGALGQPTAGGIYWESGTTIHGDKFWMAKRRYGQNVVLWWIGSSGVKKTDATFKRLHTALTAATR
jgi:hypothetical protein